VAHQYISTTLHWLRRQNYNLHIL